MSEPKKRKQKPPKQIRFPNKGLEHGKALGPDAMLVPTAEELEHASEAVKRLCSRRPDFTDKTQRTTFIMDLMADNVWQTGITCAEIAPIVGLKTNTIEWSAAEASRMLAIMCDPETSKRDFVGRLYAHIDQAQQIRDEQAAALRESDGALDKQANAAAYKAAADQVDKGLERLGEMSGLIASKSKQLQTQINVIYDAKGQLTRDVIDLLDGIIECLRPFPEAQQAVMLKFGGAELKHALTAGVQDAEIVEDE